MVRGLKAGMGCEQVLVLGRRSTAKLTRRRVLPVIPNDNKYRPQLQPDST